MSSTPLSRGMVPGDCERIVIVGAGGFGREVLQWARHAWPDHVSKIAGFLSADSSKFDGHALTLPILGSPEMFEPNSPDVFLLAIGVPQVRRRVTEQLEGRGARFLTLIHPTAIVADTAEIGTGTVICPYAIVSDAVRLGRFALINYHSSLGHDASAGDFTVLSPYAALGGGAALGDGVFMGMHAGVAPAVKIGSQSKISANSFAFFDTSENTLIFGSPARSRPYVAVNG